MSPTVRTARSLAGACGLLLLAAGTAPAAPLIQTVPYTINLPDGSHYSVSGKVETGGVGYIYTYSVKSLNALFNRDGIPTVRFFELGIAQDPSHFLHDETNKSVTSGPGILLANVGPHVSSLHNYVWTFRRGDTRVGIPILGQQTQVMSFEDSHAPTLANWSFLQVTPGQSLVDNASLQLGQLPVPGGSGIQPAPEPSTLTLSAIGIAAGLCFRRRRKGATPAVQTA